MAQRSDEAAAPGPVRKPIFKDLVLIQLAALVLLTDQLTKLLVIELLEPRESFPAEGFFRLTHIFNTGSAFGLFHDQNRALIVVSFIGIAILVMIYRSQLRPSNLLRLSLGLQFGGATGNLLDRLRLGHVTDFADVGPWPIFNVADASIVVGLVLLGWIFLVADNRKGIGAGTNKTPEPPAGPGGIPVDPEAANMGISGMTAATAGEVEESADAPSESSRELGTTQSVPCASQGQPRTSLRPQTPEDG